MTIARALPAYADESISSWERALYSSLAETERRSGSRQTVESSSRMLRDFFGRAHNKPNQTTSQDVLARAHGVGLSGRESSAVTINTRIGCASSFFRLAIRMGMIAMNLCDALEPPKIHPSPPKLQRKAGGISFDEGTPFCTYRGKGGKRGRRELTQPGICRDSAMRSGLRRLQRVRSRTLNR